jgi:hypothetical protein
VRGQARHTAIRTSQGDQSLPRVIGEAAVIERLTIIQQSFNLPMMNSKLQIKRPGKWSVKRKVRKYKRTLFTGFFSQCKQWAGAFAKSYEKKHGRAPRLAIKPASYYQVKVSSGR